MVVVFLHIFLGEMSINIFCPFSISFFLLLSSRIMCFFLIFWIKFFHTICDLQIFFFYCVACVLTFITVCLQTTFYNFDILVNNFIYFTCVICIFFLYLRRRYPTQGQKDLFLYFLLTLTYSP